MSTPVPLPPALTGSKTLRDYLASVVRTVVPIGVGILLTWLGTKVGIPIPEDIRWVVVGGVMAGYHALIRALETRWRWVGWLLGLAITPIYAGPKASGGDRSEAVIERAQGGPIVVTPPDDGTTLRVRVNGPGVEGWLQVAHRHVVRRSWFHRGRHTPWALGR